MSTPDDRGGRHRGAGVDRAPRRLVRRSVQVVAAVVSVLLFAGFGYGFYNYRDLTHNQHTVQVEGLGRPTPVPGQTTAPNVNGSAENILLVGLDSRAGLTAAQKRYYKVGQNDVSTSTDTIIVVHVPADGSRATLLSIPRDTYVQIPGFSPDKINAAYADGYYNSNGTSTDQDEKLGIDLLVKVVKNLTGLEIDHYVQVGFSGFVNIVKAIGSVPIDLCQAVDDTHAHNVDEGSDGGSGFDMAAGHHNLTPQQALEFVRQRHNIPGPVGNDLGREARQRYFLKQAFNQIATAGVLLNPVKLRDLINAVDGAFTFDNNNFGILQFAEQMSQLTAGNITGKSIPTTGNYDYGGVVGTAITVNLPAVRSFANRLFYGAPVTHSASNNPSSATSAPSTTGSSSGSASANAGCIY